MSQPRSLPRRRRVDIAASVMSVWGGDFDTPSSSSSTGFSMSSPEPSQYMTGTTTRTTNHTPRGGATGSSNLAAMSASTPLASGDRGGGVSESPDVAAPSQEQAINISTTTPNAARRYYSSSRYPKTDTSSSSSNILAPPSAAPSSSSSSMSLLFRSRAEQQQYTTEAERAARADRERLLREAAEQRRALEKAERDREAYEHAQRQRTAYERREKLRLEIEKSSYEVNGHEEDERMRISRDQVDEMRVLHQSAKRDRTACEEATRMRLALEEAEHMRQQAEEAESARIKDRLHREQEEAERLRVEFENSQRQRQELESAESLRSVVHREAEQRNAVDEEQYYECDAIQQDEAAWRKYYRDLEMYNEQVAAAAAAAAAQQSSASSPEQQQQQQQVDYEYAAQETQQQYAGDGGGTAAEAVAISPTAAAAGFEEGAEQQQQQQPYYHQAGAADAYYATTATAEGHEQHTVAFVDQPPLQSSEEQQQELPEQQQAHASLGVNPLREYLREDCMTAQQHQHQVEQQQHHSQYVHHQNGDDGDDGDEHDQQQSSSDEHNANTSHNHNKQPLTVAADEVDHPVLEIDDAPQPHRGILDEAEQTLDSDYYDESPSSSPSRSFGSQQQFLNQQQYLNQFYGANNNTDGRSSQRSSAVSQDSSPTAAAAAGVRYRLTRFYSFYCPEKVPQIGKIMEAFAGKEDILFEKLVAKYGPEPKRSEVNSDMQSNMSYDGSDPVTTGAESTNTGDRALSATQTPPPPPAAASFQQLPPQPEDQQQQQQEPAAVADATNTNTAAVSDSAAGAAVDFDAVMAAAAADDEIASSEQRHDDDGDGHDDEEDSFHVDDSGAAAAAAAAGGGTSSSSAFSAPPPPMMTVSRPSPPHDADVAEDDVNADSQFTLDSKQSRSAVSTPPPLPPTGAEPLPLYDAAHDAPQRHDGGGDYATEEQQQQQQGEEAANAVAGMEEEESAAPMAIGALYPDSGAVAEGEVAYDLQQQQQQQEEEAPVLTEDQQAEAAAAAEQQQQQLAAAVNALLVLPVDDFKQSCAAFYHHFCPEWVEQVGDVVDGYEQVENGRYTLLLEMYNRFQSVPWILAPQEGDGEAVAAEHPAATAEQEQHEEAPVFFAQPADAAVDSQAAYGTQEDGVVAPVTEHPQQDALLAEGVEPGTAEAAGEEPAAAAVLSEEGHHHHHHQYEEQQQPAAEAEDEVEDIGPPVGFATAHAATSEVEPAAAEHEQQQQQPQPQHQTVADEDPAVATMEYDASAVAPHVEQQAEATEATEESQQQLLQVAEQQPIDAATAEEQEAPPPSATEQQQQEEEAEYDVDSHVTQLEQLPLPEFTTTLSAFYEYYAPDRLERIGEILEKYATDRRKLLTALMQKYGALPALPESNDTMDHKLRRLSEMEEQQHQQQQGAGEATAAVATAPPVTAAEPPQQQAGDDDDEQQRELNALFQQLLALDDESFAQSMYTYYTSVNPEKVNDLAAVLERFQTRRADLLGSLFRKYGVLPQLHHHPADTATAAHDEHQKQEHAAVAPPQKQEVDSSSSPPRADDNKKVEEETTLGSSPSPPRASDDSSSAFAAAKLTTAMTQEERVAALRALLDLSDADFAAAVQDFYKQRPEAGKSTADVKKIVQVYAGDKRIDLLKALGGKYKCLPRPPAPQQEQQQQDEEAPKQQRRLSSTTDAPLPANITQQLQQMLPTIPSQQKPVFAALVSTSEEEFKASMVRFYFKHNPEKLVDIDALCEKYPRAIYLNKVFEKYNVLPVPLVFSPEQRTDFAALIASSHKEFKESFVKFYKKHNPEKVNDVDSFCERYSRTILLSLLMQKYNNELPKPSPAAVEATASATVAATASSSSGRRSPPQIEMSSRELMTKFFELHNPDRVPFVPDILDKYADDPAELVAALRKKYGATPQNLLAILQRERQLKDALDKQKQQQQKSGGVVAPKQEQLAANKKQPSFFSWFVGALVSFLMRGVVFPVIIAVLVHAAIELYFCAPDRSAADAAAASGVATPSRTTLDITTVWSFEALQHFVAELSSVSRNILSPSALCENWVDNLHWSSE